MPREWTIRPGLDLHLDLRGRYRRSGLEDALRRAIRSGRLPAGARLPASRTLAADLGLSRGTVTQAYEQLVAEGYLVSRQGSGTRVAAAPVPESGVSAVDGAIDGDVDWAAAPPAPRAAPPPRWDLAPGRPDLSAFPRDAWLTALRRVLATLPAAALGYHEDQGHPTLRTVLAEYLGRVRGVDTEPDRIVVCSGYQPALALVGRVLAERYGPTLAFEDPSYADHRAVATRIGTPTPVVPVDEHGIEVARIPGRAVVVTPAHQFPLGVTLAPPRRAELVAWSRRVDGIVVEDDYDGEFRFDRHPVGAVQGLAPDRVVFAGTTSKTLAPGLRLAWIAVPEPLVDAVRAAVVPGDHPGVLDQLALADLIATGGYDRHVRAARARYGRRRVRLVEEVRQRMPEATVTGIAAGLHAVVRLPGNVSAAAVVQRASGLGVRVHDLDRYRVDPDLRNDDGLVVGYATPAEHAYEPAIRAFGQALSRSS